MRKEPYAIVFSGGGAIGSWEVGCYKAIRSYHKDQPPAVVTGASAGALNATGVCAGMSAQELEGLWANLRPSDVCRFRYGWRRLGEIAVRALLKGSPLKGIQSFLESNNSLFDTSSLHGTLRRILAAYNQPFLQSQIRFAISLTDLAS